MNDVDLYVVLSQLWPAMSKSIQNPTDAVVIGNIGLEIDRRLAAAKKLKADEDDAAAQRDGNPG